MPKDGVMPDLGDIVRDSYNPVVRAIRKLEKPVICAVRPPMALLPPNDTESITVLAWVSMMATLWPPALSWQQSPALPATS